MKKILIALLSVLLLTGCSEIENRITETDNPAVSIYVDRETGVNYYIYTVGYRGGMTIRVNEDGSPYVSDPGCEEVTR